jgi:hypothetical protein
MAASAFDIKKTVDNVATLVQRIASLTASDVLAGVPAAKAGRRDGTVTNAMLAFVHEFGSPAHNIPARPFIYPGIRAAKPAIVAAMRQGGQDILRGQGSVDRTLNTVGMLARNGMVDAITNPDPPFVPLKPATIRARLRRTQAGRRQLRKIGAAAKMMPGMTADMALLIWAAQGNIQPLIDSGQLRSSLTYAVVKR